MVIFADPRPVDGLTLPFAVRALFNGEPDPSQSWTIGSIALNVPLEAALFAPGAAGGQ
jgi:hypothetical protein